jgi:uncharacterized protein YbjT (DUF2867 family)
VTVTGAGGRTGKLVLQKLLARPAQFDARGLVRDDKVLPGLTARKTSFERDDCGPLLQILENGVTRGLITGQQDL